MLDRAPGGNVGERQALRGEAHAGAAHVLQRAAVAADAVVVGDAHAGPERQLPAARGRGHVDGVHAALAHESGQQLTEQLIAPHRRIEPEHRHLLLDFAVAAHHREARAAAQRAQHFVGLARNALAKRLVCERIVEVGEHEVLPHEDPELVAHVVEHARLVRTGAGQAQHVHTGLAHLHERRPQLVL